MRLLAVLLVVFMLINTVSSVDPLSFEAWSEVNFKGTVRRFLDEGSYQLSYIVKSYRWTTNVGTICCVHMCFQGHNVGHHCSSHSASISHAAFDKVVIACGGTPVIC